MPVIVDFLIEGGVLKGYIQEITYQEETMKVKVRKRNLKIGEVYKSTATPITIYAYIRAFKGDEVGFSVLEYATSYPDFSNCGVFWVKEKDFFKVFEMQPFPGITFKSLGSLAAY